MQRAAGNHAASRAVPRLQRSIRLGKGKERVVLTVQEAWAKITPLLGGLNPEAAAHVDQTLTRFDFQNRVFADANALAEEVQAEIERDYEPSGDGPPRLLAPKQIREIIVMGEFDAMAAKYGLSAEAQQMIAAAVGADVRGLNDVYAELRARVAKGSESAESLLKWFTKQAMTLAQGVLKEAVKVVGKPPAPLAVMTAGSGAREEMFPGSDLDLALLTDTKKNSDLEALFFLMQYVEARLTVTMKQLSRELGLPGELGLAPDTGVFGVRLTPELLAEKAIAMQNTGQDARVISHTKSGRGLGERFMKERALQGTQKHALAELNDRLGEFPPLQGIDRVPHINVKTQLLRLPTLALRDLAQFFGLKSASSFDRVRELMSNGYLDDDLGGSLLVALETIARIRLKMHLHYNGETDTAAMSKRSAREGDYVLSTTELKQVMEAHMTLARFWAALRKFVDTDGQEGLKAKGFLASLFS